MLDGQPKADILIVDDNPDNLQLLSDLLAGLGYRVRPVISGLMALQAARLSLPDLVLLDINMPEMDGYTVCQEFKADPRLADIPIIFISALHELDDKIRAFQAGGIDYITKPFQFEEVLLRVESQLTLYRQHLELQERYRQIQHLQSVVRKFLSPSAWESLEASSHTTATLSRPQYEVLTLLMSDIEGFTAIAEQMEPNLLITDLSLYMNLLSTIVDQHGGEVDKFLGDGMFAFFRDAHKALDAAYQIQRQVSAFNEHQLARRRSPMPTRIGLATGKVLLAVIGSEDRREYTLVGDRVNVAARLQSQVAAGNIMIDEATYLGAGKPEYRSRETVTLKGKEQPEQVYTIHFETIEQKLPNVNLNLFHED